MRVAEYCADLHTLLATTPFLAAKVLTVDERPPDAAVIKGSLRFADGSQLDFKEFVLGPPPCRVVKYGYHYYAARNNGYTLPRAAPFAGKALALAPDVTQGLGPPRGPYREGRAAAPRRTLPRTVRSRLACRLFYAPHSIGRETTWCFGMTTHTIRPLDISRPSLITCTSQQDSSPRTNPRSRTSSGKSCEIFGPHRLEAFSVADWHP